MMVTGSKARIWHDFKEISYHDIKIDQFAQVIYLSDFNLVFVVYNPTEKKVYNLKSYHFPEGFQTISINELKNSVEEFKHPLGKKRILYDTSTFTLIPNDISEDISKEVFELNFKRSDDLQIRKEEIPFLNAGLIYGSDFNLDKLKLLTKSSDISNASIGYLQNIYDEIESFKPFALFVDINKEFLKIACFEDKQLKLFNAYPYKSKEEALYHILNVADFFNLNPDTGSFYFSGYISNDFELYKTLFKFIRYPYFIRKPDKVDLSEGLKILPAHIYYSSLAAISCE